MQHPTSHTLSYFLFVLLFTPPLFLLLSSLLHTPFLLSLSIPSPSFRHLCSTLLSFSPPTISLLHSLSLIPSSLLPYRVRNLLQATKCSSL